MPRDIDFAALRKLRTVFGVTYPPGYVIFRQGFKGTDFYVILDGEVEMFVNDGHEDAVLAVLHAGDFFGEMAVFRDEVRSASARTKIETSVLFFNGTTAYELFLASPRFAYGIIRTLCDRIGALNHEVVLLRHSLGAHRKMEADAGIATTLHHASRAAAAVSDPAAPESS